MGQRGIRNPSNQDVLYLKLRNLFFEGTENETSDNDYGQQTTDNSYFQSEMSKRSPIKRSTSFRESNSEESSSSSDHDDSIPNSQNHKGVHKRKSARDERKLPHPSPSLAVSTPVESQNSPRWWILPTFLLVLVFFSLYSISGPKCSDEENKLKVDSIKQILSNIKSKFPTQHRALWLYIFSALKTVAECDTLCPKVVLLLNREDKLSKDTSSCLVTMVGHNSSQIFEAGQPLILQGDDFNCKNGCYEELRNKVRKHGTVIIQHLEKFPKESVEALHFFCDEHDTSAAKAAYILTMTVNNDEQEATAAAEKAFNAVWPEMEGEVRMALIARLTGLVEFIKPEQSLPCVP